eukprot:jgi/Ulvmu1/8824/UM049_0004.1
MIKSATLAAGLLAWSREAAAQQSFSADFAIATDNSGESGSAPNAPNLAAAEVNGGDTVKLERQELIPVTTLPRTCDCIEATELMVDDIRPITNEFVADGNAKNSFGLSNMVWGFGQFLDHDLALTIENEDGPTIEVGAADPNDPMEVHRAITIFSQGCESSLNVHTGQIDAGPIYGTEEAYVQTTLREPNTCRLRVADGDFLPVTSEADGEGRFFFISGDVRSSEHAFLAAQHIVWVREHNRICEAVNEDPDNAEMSEDAKFDLVRNVIIAKFQQIVLTEFLPALGIFQADVEGATRLINTPAVSVEFSIAYRLGHDLIGNTVGGINIADTFNSEDFFLERSGTTSMPRVTYRPDANSVVSNIMLQLSTTVANEIDGKLSDALRNFLFGRDMGEDLAGRNIFRGRDLGVPTYAGVAECFGLEFDPTIEAETPDLWLGLLREPKLPGSPIGPTLRAVLVEQFHRSFFGPGGFYWRDNLGAIGSFKPEISSTLYSDIISANTGATVTGNVFMA